MANKFSANAERVQVVLTREEFAMLDTMCKASNQNRSEFVRMLLHNAWDKFNGDPKLQEVLSLLKEFEDKIKSVADGSN